MSDTTIFELARKIGEEILKSTESEDLKKARADFMEDEKAQQLFNEFYELRDELQLLMHSDDLTQEQADDIRSRLIAKETEIKLNPVAARLVLCENGFNNYVNSVFNIISSTITGKDPDSCGCGGGCGGGDCGGGDCGSGSCGCGGCH